MRSYGYKPGGAPETSPEHHARVEAWFAWDRQNRRLASQAADLGFAGRMEEYMDFVDTVLKPHGDKEPVKG